MTVSVRNLCQIRQWGKIFYYFDTPINRPWDGFTYAHGRKWRVIEGIDNGPYITWKCRPTQVERVGEYEFEITKHE